MAFPGPSSAPLQIVGANSGASQATTAAGLTVSIATVTAGSLLAVVVGYRQNSIPITFNVVDSAGQTWVTGPGPAYECASAYGGLRTYYFPNSAAITTLVVKPVEGNTEMSAYFFEIQGAALTSPLDASGVVSVPASGTAMSASCSGATTQASEIAIAILGDLTNNYTISGVTSGWTAEATEATTYTNQQIWAFYKVLSSTGTPTLAATLSTANYWAGIILTFKAAPPGPAVVTEPATSVQPTSAVLNGTVNPNSLSTTYQFDYGLTTGYGTSTTPTSAGSGSSAVAESASVTGLAANTTYHFRIEATNSLGTTYGADQAFTTPIVTGFPYKFGINDHDLMWTQPGQFPLALMTALGVTVHRCDLAYPDIGSYCGTFASSQCTTQINAWAAALRSVGIQPLVVVGFNGAYQNALPSASAFAANMATIVTACPGIWWEIGNELDQTSITAASYVTFFATVVSAMHTADPTCKVGPAPVVSPSDLSTGWVWAQAAFTAGLAGIPYDFFSFHDYPWPTATAPTVNIFGPWPVGPATTSTITCIPYFTAQCSAWGNTKPYWLTECGWQDIDTSATPNMTDALQASYMVTFLQGIESYGLAVVCAYELGDGGGQTYGWMTTSGTNMETLAWWVATKPVYTAVQAAFAPTTGVTARVANVAVAANTITANASGQTISPVQNAHASSGGTSSVVLSVPNTTAGNLLLAGIALPGGITVASITDGVSSSYNMLTAVDSSFETGLGDWPTSGLYGDGTCSQSSVVALSGRYSMAIQANATAVANGLMTANIGGRAGGQSPIYPVQAGLSYCLLASGRAATTSENIWVAIDWFTAAGQSGWISTSYGATTPDNTAGWTQASIIATAPTGAVLCGIRLNVQGALTMGEVHYFDCVGLFQSAAVPPWTVGGTTTNRWIQTAHSYTASNGAEIWVARNIQGGSVSVQVLLSSAASVGVNVSEWHGPLSVYPLDQWSQNYGTSTTPIAQPLTPRTASDLFYAVCASSAAITGPQSGHTPLTIDGTGNGGSYYIQPGAANVAPQWSSASAPWAVVAACFRSQ